MTDWVVATQGTDAEPTCVEPRQTYTLKRGDCHLYEVGDIHSPIISAGTKLIRIEGQNLDNVKRSNIKAA